MLAIAICNYQIEQGRQQETLKSRPKNRMLSDVKMHVPNGFASFHQGHLQHSPNYLYMMPKGLRTIIISLSSLCLLFPITPHFFPYLISPCVQSIADGSLPHKPLGCNRSQSNFTVDISTGRRLRILQIMGKRAPKAEKAETKQKQEKKEEESPAEDNHFEVFTPKFYETIDSFKNFYTEVLTLKAKDEGSDSTGFAEVRKRVSGKLEHESSKILKEELADLEKWIEEQQRKLAGEAAKIEEAYKANSSSLASTGSFTDEEIRRQLQPIQAKIDEKNATHASFGSLLKRAREIYQ